MNQSDFTPPARVPKHESELMADVPEPTAEAIENPWAKRVADLQRQLAEVKLTIAHQDTVHREHLAARDAKIQERELQLCKAVDKLAELRALLQEKDAALAAVDKSCWACGVSNNEGFGRAKAARERKETTT